MQYSVLLVDNNSESLQASTRELKQRGLNILGCLNFEKACDLLKEDGTIHIVLSEWELHSKEESSDMVRGLNIFRKFIALRHEVSLFLYTHIKDSKSLTSGGIID